MGFKVVVLFEVVGKDYGLYIGLSNNLIENGIGELVVVIWENKGFVGLDMEMVEFQDEDNYFVLIYVLIEIKYFIVLNMVGIVFVFFFIGVCSFEMVSVLYDLFVCNIFIWCFDFLGFFGRFDDG